MGAGLGLSSDDHELPDDADEAGLETTGGKILITPGATIPLRDDAAEDEDLRDDAGEADLETTGGKIIIGPGATIPLRDDAAEDDDLRDDAEDLRDDAEDLRDDAGEADLLGLSSKRSPATLPTGRF